MTRVKQALSVSGWSQRTRRVVTGMLSLVAVALLAATATLGFRHLENSDITDARVAAASAAETKVPQLLSYDFTTVDAQLGTALDNLTGEFRSQYDTLVQQVIAPAAKDKGVVTSATVAQVSVVDVTSDAVNLLLFLNQSTTARDTPDPKLDGSRVTVSMKKVGADWLIADVSPV
jgi:Mce-associated membrane protein